MSTDTARRNETIRYLEVHAPDWLAERRAKNKRWATRFYWLLVFPYGAVCAAGAAVCAYVGLADSAFFFISAFVMAACSWAMFFWLGPRVRHVGRTGDFR